MSWAALASNQMVTFTNAQTSPFSLKSGQSPVTSNQCMTKANILDKYNVTISGYADNQLVPKSAWVGASFSYGVSLSRLTGPSACVFSFPNTWYSATSNPVFVGNQLFSNAELTIPFIGADLWYGADGAMFGASYQVSNAGIIIDIYNCGF